MNAESREAVFVELRKKGIKAIKVVASDGSKANGEIHGVRKRVVATLVIAAVAATASLYFLLPRSGSSVPLPAVNNPRLIATPLPRQPVNGDRSRIEAAANSFKHTAEVFLAQFAEPGRMPKIAAGNTSSTLTVPQTIWPSSVEIEAALADPIDFQSSEFTEQIDLKRIVVGMKDEIRQYLQGGGDANGYIQDLIKRQRTEIEQREKAEARLNELLFPKRYEQHTIDLKSAYQYWLLANAQLKSMGIYELPLPEKLLHYQAALDSIE